MSNKFWSITWTLLIAIALIGCNNDEEVQGEEANNPEDEKVNENLADETDEDEEDVVEPELDEETEDTTSESNQASANFDELIQYMEETSEGTVTVLYENNQAQTHEVDQFSVKLEQYTVVELIDFHTSFAIPFDDETDGGVLIAEYTMTNESDEDLYYMPALNLSYTGATKSFNNHQYLLPEEEQIPNKLSHSSDYLIEAGETITGYIAYPFGETAFEQALSAGSVMIDVPAPFETQGDVNSTIGQSGSFTLSLNEEGAERAEHNSGFYSDLITAADMGDKELIKSDDNLDQVDTLGDVSLTLEGYQFTEFTPNDYEAPRFENFVNGVVLLTVRFEIDNQSDDDLSQRYITSTLHINDGMQFTINEGMLLDYNYEDVIEAGTTGELLQIYTLDQEQYEKIWSDKTFEIEIGPMRDHDGTDISKGHRVTFTLPE